MTGLISDYLGAGTLAERPVDPGVGKGTLALYSAEDTKQVFRWDISTTKWVEVAPKVIGGGGGGGGSGSVDYKAAVPLTLPDPANFVMYRGSNELLCVPEVTSDRVRLDITTSASPWRDEQGFAWMTPLPQGTTWEATALCQLPQTTATYVFAGLMMRKADGLSRIFGTSHLSGNTAQFTWNTVVAPNNLGGWTHQNDGSMNTSTFEKVLWMRLQRNDTSYFFYTSQDGIIWDQLMTFPVQDLSDVVEVGIGLNPRLIGSYATRNNRRLGFTMFHWDLTSTLSPKP